MKRILSFALGNIWKWAAVGDMSPLINYVRELDISGVELTLAFKDELYSFKLSEDDKSWLRNLDYVSIHAPFRLIERSESKEEVIRQLDIISRLYDDIDAKNVIVHPTDLPTPEILEKYNFNISTENLPPKRNVTISDLEKILGSYPKIKLCLDVAHAYLWSKHETGKLVKAFKEKISQVHFSGTYRKKDHQSLRSVGKDFLFSIQPLRELNVPIVIEETMEEKDLKFVKEEIRYVRDLLGKIDKGIIY